MADRIIHPASLVRQLFLYDPETGSLVHKPRDEALFHRRADMLRWNTCFAGKAADSSKKNGYKTVCVSNRNYQAHRVAWAIVYGDWPEDVIDHINGDPSDNRLANLRAVSRALNQRNLTVKSTSSGGAIGVYYDRGMYVAKIGSKPQQHLGRHLTFEGALKARQDAEKRLGYHDNHGRKSHVA